MLLPPYLRLIKVNTPASGLNGRWQVLRSFSGAKTGAGKADEAAGLTPGNEDNAAGVCFSPEKPCLPLSIEGIFLALWQHDKLKKFYPNLRESKLNKPRLNLLIPTEYFESSPARKQFLQKLVDTNGLSCLMNAKYEHSGIKTDLREISRELLSPAGYEEFLQSAHDCFINEYCKSKELCADIPEEIKTYPSKLYDAGSSEDFVFRELQYLYSKKSMGNFSGGFY